MLVFFCWQALRHTFEKPTGKQKTDGGIITSRTFVMEVLDLIALHGLWAQAHSRPWVSLGWVRRYCWYSERASCFISATYSSKGIICPCKPLIGIDLMHPAFLPDVKLLLGGVHPATDPLAGQSSAHIVVLAVDRQLPIGPNRPSKGLLIDLHEPAVRIDRLWNGCRSGGKAGQATRGGWLPQERAWLGRSLL